jgi:hypothetical protein
MGPAVERVCAMPNDEHRLRIVTFMTDGFVGNDQEIIGLVKKYRDKSRWFPFGTGNSVNRNLIDNIAKEGGGEPDYVLLNSNAEDVGSKFYKRIASPVLTDVKVDFGDLKVKDVYPKDLSDVWAEKPLYFEGRYTAPGAGTITLSGFAAGKPYKQTLKVDFPSNSAKHDVLGSIWARAKVDRLTAEDYFGSQRGNPNKEIKDEIIETALAHHIMTQYTSFVAVEEKTVTKDGASKSVTVPVEMPDGVSYESTLGHNEQQRAPWAASSMMKSAIRGRAMGGGGANAYSPNFSNSSYRRALASPEPSKMLSSVAGSKEALSLNAPLSGASAGKGDAGAYNGLPGSPAQSESLKKGEVRGQLLRDKDSKLANKAIDDRETDALQANKLSSVLRRLVDGKLSSDEQGRLHIHSGRITVRVSMAQNDENLAALKRLGVSVLHNTKQGILVVEIDVNKLRDLEKLSFVHSITPSKGTESD